MKRFLLPERFQHKLLLVSTQYDLLTWTNCLEKCVDSKIMISEIELSTCETRAFFFFIKQPDCQTFRQAGNKPTVHPNDLNQHTHACQLFVCRINRTILKVLKVNCMKIVHIHKTKPTVSRREMFGFTTGSTCMFERCAKC